MSLSAATSRQSVTGISDLQSRALASCARPAAGIPQAAVKASDQRSCIPTGQGWAINVRKYLLRHGQTNSTICLSPAEEQLP